MINVMIKIKFYSLKFWKSFFFSQRLLNFVFAKSFREKLLLATVRNSVAANAWLEALVSLTTGSAWRILVITEILMYSFN